MQFMDKYSDLVFFIIAVFYFYVRVIRDVTFDSWLQVAVDVIMIIGTVMFVISMSLTIYRRFIERKNKKVS
jgi:hypothetical protein